MSHPDTGQVETEARRERRRLNIFMNLNLLMNLIFVGIVMILFQHLVVKNVLKTPNMNGNLIEKLS